LITESNFFKYKGDRGVAISNSIPTGWNGKRYTALAPPWDLVKRFRDEKVTEAQFREEYAEKILSKLDRRKVKAELEGMTLLCWEGDGKFCHRHLALKWLNEKEEKEDV